ncbi:MAG TPA: ABC transporter ATP-binding protein [Actinomycetes bacterium]|nr:ABC transporter ATP-binding protein [Actinomycetes bacterium]
MRTLPLADPGTPDLRSPTRLLLWVARGQLGVLLAGMGFGVLWMGAQAVLPALVGRAIDEGVAGGDAGALLRWSGLIFAAGVGGAAAGILRHRVAVVSWLTATYRVQQLLVRQAVRLGGSLARRVATGELVGVGSQDAERVGAAMDITARLTGALVSFVVVAVLMLRTSPTLGLVVVVGVPLLSGALAPLLRPLHARRARHRELVGALTTLGADTVSGLRVLRGVGGEEEFSRRYAAASQEVRAAGVAAARVQSLLDAAQVALPGVFVVAVTFLGALLVTSGRISVGELVAFYGYAAFLLLPVRTVTEAADKFTRALVAARRAVRVLSLEPELPSGGTAAEPPPGSVLVDGPSGLVVRPGRLTAVVAGVPEEAAAIADRLGRFADPGADGADAGDAVTLGGVPLRDLPLEVVRRRVLVSEHDPRLFTGRLAGELDPTGAAPAGRLLAAIHTASAEDVLEALPDGLATEVEERGRSFSGGQRQRLGLARALVADPEILVLVEPTSAVDAHTEARVGERLRALRRGRATVVCTTSPLLLDHADTVALVAGGRVVAEGSHRQLLRGEPRYRAVVIRGEAS